MNVVRLDINVQMCGIFDLILAQLSLAEFHGHII